MAVTRSNAWDLPDRGDGLLDMVDPMVPAYIQALGPYEIATLTTAVNGQTVFRNWVQNTYNSGDLDYWNNEPGSSGSVQSGSWWRAWNGGHGPGSEFVENPRHRVVFCGGGHNDGTFNALVAYDFNGTSEPQGYTALMEPTPISQLNYPIGPVDNRNQDGKPAAVHMNHGSCTTKEGKYVRGPCARQNDGGGFTPSTEVWDPDGSFASPVASAPFAADVSVVYDPTTDKVLVPRTGDFAYAFFDVATRTYSATKFLSGSLTIGYETMVHDPTRRVGSNIGRVFTFPSGRVYQVDWVNETMTPEANHNQGSLIREANGAFYDAENDAIWAFGNGPNNWGTIFELTGLDTPQSLTSTPHNLVDSVGGAALATVGSAGGGGGPVQNGFFGRWAWFPDWRALGFIGHDGLPAQIIRIP